LGEEKTKKRRRGRKKITLHSTREYRNLKNSGTATRRARRCGKSGRSTWVSADKDGGN